MVMLLVNGLIWFEIIGFTIANIFSHFLPSVPPDVGLTILELVPKYGYPLESHEVATDDGYILTLHRIPHGKFNTSHPNRPAVLLMHGILGSSMDFVVLGPKQALGFLLADAGYDVWFGNQRGNSWSKKHVNLDPDIASEFWDFSFHEIGIFDVAASLDYIIGKTRQNKISCVSYSQGTTAFFTLLSTRPEYNEKIKVLFTLAPVAYMQNIRLTIVHIILDFSDILLKIATLLNINEVLPHMKIFTGLGTILCNDDSVFQEVCVELMAVLLGNEPLLNKTTIPLFLSASAAGASLKQFQHFLMNIESGKFRPYDYGCTENFSKYGCAYPPDYDLSKITAPIVIKSCDNDVFAPPEDVDILANQLPNLKERLRNLPKDFAHLDFLYSKNIEKLLNYDILNSLRIYN